MKPPARKRTKPNRQLYLEPVRPPPKVTRRWLQLEQRELLKALKISRSFTRGDGDIDYDFLRKFVPARSISEIRSVVEYLKNRVISLASNKLKKKRLEEKFRKPIEEWARMASAIAGAREEPISAAFSQMLIVSSTEPCTLRNCDPPQVQRPATDRPVGRTITLRPMPRLPIKVEHPGTNTACPVLVHNTPGPAKDPARRLAAPSQVDRVLNGIVPPPQQQLPTTAGTSPKILAAPASSPQPASQTATPVTGQVSPGCGSVAVVKTQSVGSSLLQTTQQPSEQSPTTMSTSSTSKSTSSGPHAPLSSSATGQTPVPSTAPSSEASSAPPKHPLATPGVAFHSPRTFGVKSVVDFERIYRYLSSIHQPNDDCHLTPMESAIMLDLLMSLPEELPLLNCNKLHKHLIQVYRFLSTTANAKVAGEKFKELKDVLRARDGKGTNGQPRAARTADGSDVTASGVKKLQPNEAESQSSGSTNASGQSSGSTNASGQSSGSTNASGQSSGSTNASGQSSGSTNASGQSSGSTNASGQSSGSTNASGQSSGSTNASGQSSGSTNASGQSSGSTNASGQSSGSTNASGQSGDSDEMGLCPALNPFMVPLKLLMRK
ncbi:hypothetical protein VZT92_016850 [Zoarces viviparus]|uniref:snRNA-activating protein complex subunit 2 n=1 Tax=Zoarces viviparus TaxID=48416 RepID=A0AAW1EQW0_ZOAVI